MFECILRLLSPIYHLKLASVPFCRVIARKTYHIQAVGSDEVHNVYEAVQGAVRGHVSVASIVGDRWGSRQVGELCTVGKGN